MLDFFSQPKIDNLALSSYIKHHVVKLHVSVNDALTVQIHQSSYYIHRQFVVTKCVSLSQSCLASWNVSPCDEVLQILVAEFAEQVDFNLFVVLECNSVRENLMWAIASWSFLILGLYLLRVLGLNFAEHYVIRTVRLVKYDHLKFRFYWRLFITKFGFFLLWVCFEFHPCGMVGEYMGVREKCVGFGLSKEAVKFFVVLIFWIEARFDWDNFRCVEPHVHVISYLVHLRKTSRADLA